MDSFWSCHPIKEWFCGRQGKSLRILDVGCGKGLFTRDLATGITAKWGLKQSKVTGLDIVKSPGDVFAQIPSPFEFVKHDGDGNVLPFDDGSMDFVSCNHVLEHVFETEKLLREFKRVLAKDGLCLVSVPNIACWINRVAFLWGSQPLGSEIGTEKVSYGFRPAFLQRKLELFHPAGHVRDFTPRGLQDITEHCGFRVAGWWKQSPGFIARFHKWSGRNMAVILRPCP